MWQGSSSNTGGVNSGGESESLGAWCSAGCSVRWGNLEKGSGGEVSMRPEHLVIVHRRRPFLALLGNLDFIQQPVGPFAGKL